MSFEEFCVYCIEQYQINNAYLDNHISPQHTFVSPNVNKIFKFEDGLDSALAEVFADIGLKLSGELRLPKLNSSVKDNSVLCKKTKSLIYEFYAEDFERFGYEK